VRIHAIQTGTVQVKERQRRGVGPGPLRAAATMLDRAWTEPLPILAWLVEHEEGLIVVDTGETARASQPGHFPAWHPYFRLAVRARVAPEEEIGPQLARLGFSTGDVRRVVLTHLHTDHAGGLDHFPDSEVLVTREELAFASGALGKLRGYLPDRRPAWLQPTLVDFEQRAFGPFARSLALTRAGDVTLLPTPGHTPGHLSVAVRDGDRVILLAGDVSYTEGLLLEDVADGVTTDVAGARRAMALVRELAAAEPVVYLPSHDPQAVARLQERRAVTAASR
jgi:glyoxylase-like metal-dependent hydrolase (beta-lactamase superfamily II)